MAAEDTDVLRRLEERLGRASEAAERLLGEAAARAGSGAGQAPVDAPGETGGPPPAGWQIPRRDQPRPSDLEPLLELVRSVRELIPDDLQRRLAEALRDLLLALRALIDWYLERSERGRGGAAEVEEIPIQ